MSKNKPRSSKKTEDIDKPIKVSVVNGWKIYFHSLFLNKLESLKRQVEHFKKTLSDDDFKTHALVKRYARIVKMIFEVVPSDPANPMFRMGDTMGDIGRNWRRAKFGQQERIFFRYSAKAKAIIFGWFNDEETKRAYGSKTDAYAVFEKMLKDGNPPNSSVELILLPAVESQK